MSKFKVGDRVQVPTFEREPLKPFINGTIEQVSSKDADWFGIQLDEQILYVGSDKPFDYVYRNAEHLKLIDNGKG